MNFSAVILAGGRSSRMGRDKAWLSFGGQSLLARQIELLRELAPAELFVSGRTDTEYSSFGCPVLSDRYPDAGPLAGIAVALAAASAPLVLVLAVDMPRLTTGVLRNLLQACTAEVGVVPRVNWQIEPLAAVYPKIAEPVAVDLLERGRRAVQTFVERCHQLGHVTFHDLDASEHRWFANWNSPADLPLRLATGIKHGEVMNSHPLPDPLTGA